MIEEVIKKLSLARIGQVIIYAIAVGVSIKIFAAVWRHFWNIDTGQREKYMLVGATVVILVMWGERGIRGASISAGLVISGYFVIKLIKKYLGGL